MPTPLEIPAEVRKEEGRWLRNCPTCNKVISHLRRNYCVHSHLLKQPCKKCSNATNHPSGMVGPVRVAWYNAFYKSAISRGLEWSISAEDVAYQYELQNGKCAFSGLEIGWSEKNWVHTASIDRIDNSKGYTPDNIHLVHKRINMMRGSLSAQEFVGFCQAVAQNKKW